MKRKSTMVVGGLLLTAGVAGLAGMGVAQKATPASIIAEKAPPRGMAPTESAARRALSPDAAQAKVAMAELRAQGPEGLQTLLAEHQALLEHAKAMTPAKRLELPEWQRLTAAIDTVGAQCDDWASQLYWYDDWEQAKQASLATGKPILSLRLLGKLHDELSCANSRFFRTVLYPNAEIGKYMREHYVLHWQSVRPVPKVTVDFGDGRKIETTITGNSIHYVLTPQGEIIDALPGLYAPGAFLRWLQNSDSTFKTISNQEEPRRSEVLANYHKMRRSLVAAAWKHDLNRIGVTAVTEPAVAQAAIPVKQPVTPPQQPATPLLVPSNAPLQPVNLPNSTLPANLFSIVSPSPRRIIVTPGGGLLAPDARTASRRAMTKMASEPLVNMITVEVPRDSDELKSATDDVAWEKIAALYSNEARLDAGSLGVLKGKTPPGADAEQMIANLQKSIALDTVRNEYMLHTKIHEWLGAGNNSRDVTAFNQRVYAELFLTPDTDPWLGLLPANAYTAVTNGGVVTQ